MCVLFLLVPVRFLLLLLATEMAAQGIAFEAMTML